MFAILVIGMCYLARHGKLKKRCSVSQDQEGTMNDAGPEESHETVIMIDY